MRAVNLLPSDLRSATAGGSGSSGMGAYIVLGALSVLLVVVAAWAVSTRQVNDRRAEVARLNAEAAQAEAEAGNLQSFQQFVTTARTRAQAVNDLAKKRFDWSSSLEQVSRTLPETTWITTMAASTSPAVTIGSSNPLRAALESPAIEILGCTTSQDDVARLMARLRSMDSVEKVSLATSTKNDASDTGGGATAEGGGDCRSGSDQIPQFNIVVFFKGSAAAATTETASTTSTSTATGAPK